VDHAPPIIPAYDTEKRFSRTISGTPGAFQDKSLCAHHNPSLDTTTPQASIKVSSLKEASWCANLTRTLWHTWPSHQQPNVPEQLHRHEQPETGARVSKERLLPSRQQQRATSQTPRARHARPRTSAHSTSYASTEHARQPYGPRHRLHGARLPPIVPPFEAGPRLRSNTAQDLTRTTSETPREEEATIKARQDNILGRHRNE
jgi:hypothetical protein